MNRWRSVLNITVIVSALGYFVDIYDLLLFSIVRVASLKDLGVSEDQLLEKGVFLLNMQMIGLLLGGIFWGILGDKRGRLSVLFGSIFIYSVANIANGFVHSVEAYGVWRFIAGFGLAGEIGAAITLVSEVLPQKYRGYGTTVVASIGILGAVVAALVGDYFSWRVSFMIGGVLGLLLLVMRFSMLESGLFATIKQAAVRRGDLRILLFPGSRFLRYLACIAVGVPLWFVIGILITFSPEITKTLNIRETIHSGKAVMFCYAGLSLGDLVSGFLSQWIQSRKKVLVGFILATYVGVLIYVTSDSLTAAQFYFLCAVLGFLIGYWAIFMTVASEQFGTNIRATVTTTAPNFVRGAVVPATLLFRYLSEYFSLPISALIVGTLCLSLALISALYLPETYHRELDFTEE